MTQAKELHKDVAFIERTFFEQISTLTKKSNIDSFEAQHSDLWM